MMELLYYVRIDILNLAWKPTNGMTYSFTETSIRFQNTRIFQGVKKLLLKTLALLFT